eukprot:COSAG06_NODE_11227_length_1541_cov_42.169903_2_plen_198_part_00
MARLCHAVVAQFFVTLLPLAFWPTDDISFWNSCLVFCGGRLKRTPTATGAMRCRLIRHNIPPGVPRLSLQRRKHEELQAQVEHGLVHMPWKNPGRDDTNVAVDSLTCHRAKGRCHAHVRARVAACREAARQGPAPVGRARGTRRAGRKKATAWARVGAVVGASELAQEERGRYEVGQVLEQPRDQPGPPAGFAPCAA